MGGGKRMTKQAQLRDRVRINGIGRREPDHSVMSSGFALTPNVDAELWNSWLAANKDSDAVKKGLVFAQTKTDSAAAQAKDHRSEITGLEPLDPENLPLEFRRKIETVPAKDRPGAAV